MKAIIVLLLFICSSSFAQKIPLKGEFSENQTDRYYENQIFQEILKTQTQFEETYNTSEHYALKVTIDVSKVYRIEGIQTLLSGNAKINFILRKPSLTSDTSWTYIQSIKTNHQHLISEEVVKRFIQNNGPQKMSVVILNNLEKNCEQILTQSNRLIEKQNWKEAYLLTKSLLNTDCKTEALKKIESIEDAYASDYCQNQLPRIKILTQSGVDYKMQKGLEMLYYYPKNAKCRKEIEEISKSVGEYYAKSKGTTINISLDKNLETLFGY